MIRIGVIQVIRVVIDVIWIKVIQDYRIFANNIFNFKIIITLSIFENSVVSRVFTFTLCCAMPWRSPVGEIQHQSIKDAEDPNLSWWESFTNIPPGTNIMSESSSILQAINLLPYDTNGSWWVHLNAVSPPFKINTHFITMFLTTNGYFSITVSSSINGSNNLVNVNECSSKRALLITSSS